MSLISDLLHFREDAARLEGIESFKVLSKATLDAIVLKRPANKEELTQIKGIKEAKYRKYGKAILALVAAHSLGNAGAEPETEVTEEGVPSVLSVNDFLETINVELSGFAARIQGEVTDINIWQHRVVFFTLKDKEAESVLKCSMSYQHYALMGADIAVGTEVIAEGYPKIYKPRGELSFQVVTLELFGEGALKKAYDELYKKLELDGAFDASQKKTLPEYPERIALITSLDGAALGDFQMNIGRFGLHIDLYPSGVEGSRAIHELMNAVRAVAKKADQYDVLVIVRGGGSLESLAAFNNEALVNLIRELPLPVLAGIGHEKDITLTALVSDRMESTPTACALCLTNNWTAARENIYTFSEKLPRIFESILFQKKEQLSEAHHSLFFALADLKNVATKSEQQILFWIQECINRIKIHQEYLATTNLSFTQKLVENIAKTKNILQNATQYLTQVNPLRVLTLGYSIIRNQSGIVTDAKKVKVGDILDIRLAGGSLTVSVEKID